MANGMGFARSLQRVQGCGYTWLQEVPKLRQPDVLLH